MSAKTLSSRRLTPAVLSLFLFCVTGCFSGGERARLTQDNQRLRQNVERLERTVGKREAAIAGLNQQIENLQGFDPRRPADLFAPVKIQIQSLSGGADYDDEPGDDGVTVYLRPLDRDGDVVKTPGRIQIQLLDNNNLSQPRLIAVYDFDDPAALRRLWYGSFGTNHYTLKCPFPDGIRLPEQPRLIISAEFVDYLTGATLTATKEVEFSHPRKLVGG